MKKKNQIPKYHAPNPKEYNKEDARLIGEKLPNPVRYWGEKPKNL